MFFLEKLQVFYSIYIEGIDRFSNEFNIVVIINKISTNGDISLIYVLATILLLGGFIQGLILIIESFYYPIFPKRGMLYQSIMYDNKKYNEGSKSWIGKFFWGLFFISPIIPFLFYISFPPILFFVLLYILHEFKAVFIVVFFILILEYFSYLSKL